MAVILTERKVSEITAGWFESLAVGERQRLLLLVSHFLRVPGPWLKTLNIRRAQYECFDFHNWLNGILRVVFFDWKYTNTPLPSLAVTKSFDFDD